MKMNEIFVIYKIKYRIQNKLYHFKILSFLREFDHQTNAETSGHEQIKILSPFALLTLPTVGQNFPLLLTHSNGYAACYLVNLCGQFQLAIYAAVYGAFLTISGVEYAS